MVHPHRVAGTALEILSIEQKARQLTSGTPEAGVQTPFALFFPFVFSGSLGTHPTPVKDHAPHRKLQCLPASPQATINLTYAVGGGNTCVTSTHEVRDEAIPSAGSLPSRASSCMHSFSAWWKCLPT